MEDRLRDKTRRDALREGRDPAALIEGGGWITIAAKPKNKRMRGSA
jgi:hypothetical protein